MEAPAGAPPPEAGPEAQDAAIAALAALSIATSDPKQIQNNLDPKSQQTFSTQAASHPSSRAMAPTSISPLKATIASPPDAYAPGNAAPIGTSPVMCVGAPSPVPAATATTATTAAADPTPTSAATNAAGPTPGPDSAVSTAAAADPTSIAAAATIVSATPATPTPTAATPAAAASPPPPPGPCPDPRVEGNTAALTALRELICWPVLYGVEGAALGVRWPRGLLLHGPPGCGKTLMVQAVAAEAGAVLHVVTAAHVTGAYTGESERRLRAVWAEAEADAEAGRLAVLFLDEVDALCPRRDSGRAPDTRLVAQLLTLLDGAASGSRGSTQPTPQAPTHATATSANTPKPDGGGIPPPRRGHLVVVGATNRPNALDPALRRPGRLDREVAVGLPDAEQRAAILRLHTRGLQLADDVDLAAVAAVCNGYSGADLAGAAREAAMAALAEVAAETYGIGTAAAATLPAAALPPLVTPPPVLVVRSAHLTTALRKVRPAVMRGAELNIPSVSWDDVGGLEDVKRRLRQAVEWPLRHAAAFERLGLSAPRGVLLHGPPGCSKTTLARAAATASGAAFQALSCAQLFSMWVGEGESVLRAAFQRARLAAPAILFLDELDAVAGRREDEGPGRGGAGGGGGPDAGLRLLTTLLTEMDGIELAAGVLVLGATNRPGSLDPALLRPGRFSTLLFVPPPDEAGRRAALQVHCRRVPLGADVDLGWVAAETEGYTGAELAAICREAALAALREGFTGGPVAGQPHDTQQQQQEVAGRHFAAALRAVRPGLSAAELEAYAAWGRRRGGVGGVGGEERGTDSGSEN